MESRRNNKTITGLRAGKSSTETIFGDLVPAVDNFYDLGSTTQNWQDVYATKGSFNDSVGSKVVTASDFMSSSTLTVSTAATIKDLTLTGSLELLATVATMYRVNVTDKLTTKDLNVTGTVTFASQPEFNGFVASGGVILKDGLLVRGGTTSREGHIIYGGIDVNKSLQSNGVFIANGQSIFYGETIIKTPIFKPDSTVNASPDEDEIKELLRRKGNKSITGPYITTDGTMRFYYKYGLTGYFYVDFTGTSF